MGHTVYLHNTYFYMFLIEHLLELMLKKKIMNLRRHFSKNLGAEEANLALVVLYHFTAKG